MPDITIAREQRVAEQEKALEVSSKGMVINHPPTEDEWFEFGDMILRMKGAIQFAIGDWINYGEAQTGWGEKYIQALTNTAYEYGTLRNYASVAASFDLSHRFDNVSWSHHNVVMPLEPPDRDRFLRKAADEKLNRDELKKAVDVFLGKPTPPQSIVKKREVNLVDRAMMLATPDNPGFVYIMMHEEDLQEWGKLEYSRVNKPGKFFLSIAFQPDAEPESDVRP